jgi:hypothetical protein
MLLGPGPPAPITKLVAQQKPTQLVALPLDLLTDVFSQPQQIAGSAV